MADRCFFIKNTFVIKPLQKSPLISRMIVVVVIFGSFICLFSSKQIDVIHNSLNLMKIELWFKNRISVQPKPIDIIHNNPKLMKMEPRFKNWIPAPVSVEPKPVDIVHNNPKLIETKPKFKNWIPVPVLGQPKPVSAGSDLAELENKNPASPKTPWGSLRVPLSVQPKTVSSGSDWTGLEKNNSASPKTPWGMFQDQGTKGGDGTKEGEGEEGGRRRRRRRRGVRRKDETERRSEPSRSWLGLGSSKTETNRPDLGPTKTGRDLEPWVELTEQDCHHHHSIPQSETSYVHYPQPTTYSRNECACIPVRYFVILSMQRSGTGWLVSLLNSHVNISSCSVFLNEEIGNISAITSTLDKVYNLDWFGSVFKNGCTAAVGFKWMLNQGPMMYHKQLVEYFNRRGVSIIFLFRRNLLRRLVSDIANNHDRDAKQINGTHKAHVHSINEADALAKYKPTINPKLLIRNLRQANKSIVDSLKYFGSIRHIVLYYEDLIQDHTKLRLVQEFLGVPQRDLKSPHVKIHTRPLSQQIANWDAVYTALKKTQYESFLDAD